jgi:hypothetical protein
VVEGQTQSAGTAQPPVKAAPATDSDHDPAVTGRDTSADETPSAAQAQRTDQAGGSRGGRDPGAARADEGPGPSHTTHQAADPAEAEGAARAHGTDVAGGGSAPAAGSVASESREASETSPPVAEARDPQSSSAESAPSRGAVEVPSRAPAAPAPEPSWGKVLATTVSLWTSRRLRRLTGSGRGGGQGGAATTEARPRRGGFRWPLVVFVLVLVILALVGLQLSGALSQHSKGQAATGTHDGGTSNSGSNRALSAAQAARSQAATWVTQQVTGSAMIACDPLMCSTLQSDGVAAARLVTVQATTPDPLGADVVVATSSIRSQFGRSLVSEYAPQLLATFGSGASRVDVRAVAPDGAAAFATAESADRAQRIKAGTQLIRNDSLIGEKDASQIRAGRVDSRLLITLASLLSQRPLDVGSFEITGPGAPVLYRQVTIVDAPGQTGTTALQADLNQVRTQPSSYQPLHAEIVQLANGQSALRIEFGAPDPPGLLSGGGNS